MVGFSFEVIIKNSILCSMISRNWSVNCMGNTSCLTSLPELFFWPSLKVRIRKILIHSWSTSRMIHTFHMSSKSIMLIKIIYLIKFCLRRLILFRIIELSRQPHFHLEVSPKYLDKYIARKLTQLNFGKGYFEPELCVMGEIMHAASTPKKLRDKATWKKIIFKSLSLDQSMYSLIDQSMHSSMKW